MKLFKKISAAILAGVMALSMVACGTTGTTTEKLEEEIKNPSTPATTKIMAALNMGRAEVDAELLVNDEKLAEKAQIMLDTIYADAEDDKTLYVGTEYKRVNFSFKSVNSVLNEKGKSFSGETWAWAKDVTDTTPFTEMSKNATGNNCLDSTCIFVPSTQVITKLGRVGAGINYGQKVGVATKDIHGNTYFVILIK